MNPLELKNNDDLYRYLVSLGDELEQRGKSEASSEVMLASQFAFGSPSEFFHEAMNALTSVQAKCKDVLTELQLADLEIVVEHIRKAFERIGGA